MPSPPGKPLPFNTTYRKASLDAAFDFSHFSRHVAREHVQDGYWEFNSKPGEKNGDDYLAYRRGLHSPEEVLIAAERGDGPDDDIQLRWVSGELDTYKSPRIGNAQHHLRAIHQERSLLRLPASFQGQPPVYPVDCERKLLEHRIKTWGHAVGAPEASHLTQITDEARRAEEPASIVTSNLHGANGHSVAAEVTCLVCEKLLVSRRSESIWQVHSERRLPTQINWHSESCRSKEILEKKPHASHFPSPSMMSLTPEERLQPLHRQPVDSEVAAEEATVVPENSHGNNRTGDDDDDLMKGYEDAFDLEIPPDKIPIDGSDQVLSSLIPCIDCGEYESHKHDCYIGGIALLKKPTMAQIRELAAAVQKFDPGPWTTHKGDPPTPEPEDYAVVLKGMVEIIRNQESYKNNPDLHEIPDEILPFFWAFTASENVDSRVGRIVRDEEGNIINGDEPDVRAFLNPFRLTGWSD